MSCKLVTLKIDAEWLNHAKAASDSNLETLCGVRSNALLSMHKTETKKGQKIDCPNCYKIFMTARLFKLGDFEAIT